MSYDYPQYGTLNIGSLASIFNNTSASYKYVFFLSLLNLIEEYPSKKEFSFKEIEVEMIYIGWFPHTYYKLSFGLNDKLGNNIDLIGDIDIKNGDNRSVKNYIKSKITPLKSTLLDMVPYRLLSVFVDDRSVNKTSNKDVITWANSLKDSPNSLYYFKQSKECKKENSIIVSDPWLKYIRDNFRIIKDYATYNFLSYMEKRNPNVLNLSTKLFPPSNESRNLTSSKNFWLSLADHSSVRCIYTGDSLDKDNISIDHYLPWSFTAHNREWNLIPTSKEVNSSKSNRLPDIRYYNKFLDLQYVALNEYKEIQKGKKYMENYYIDLCITKNYLTLDDLKSKYNKIYSPLFKMAINQGFETGWVYNG